MIGLNRNCIKEYEAKINPIWNSFAPKKFFAYVGKTGIKIPKPIKSIKIVIKIAIIWKRLDGIYFLIKLKETTNIKKKSYNC